MSAVVRSSGSGLKVGSHEGEPATGRARGNNEDAGREDSLFDGAGSGRAVETVAVPQVRDDASPTGEARGTCLQRPLGWPASEQERARAGKTCLRLPPQAEWRADSRTPGVRAKRLPLERAARPGRPRSRSASPPRRDAARRRWSRADRQRAQQSTGLSAQRDGPRQGGPADRQCQSTETPGATDQSSDGHVGKNT
jgi:hypothetical protein